MARVVVRAGTTRDKQAVTLARDYRPREIDRDLPRNGGRDSAVDDEERAAAEPLTCATCGLPLGDDPDDAASGDGGRPICGECERANHFEVLDSLDGELDDTLP